MREIKFRAWDSNPGKGLMNYEPNTIKDGELINDIFKDDNVVWMQYTGLKDKNGKEIYEGDVVTPEYPTLRNITDAWVIEYGHTGSFVLADGSFKEVLHNQVYNKWKLEVIGNIYENPELLKDGS